jgi:hypothetical protein
MEYKVVHQFLALLLLLAVATVAMEQTQARTVDLAVLVAVVAGEMVAERQQAVLVILLQRLLHRETMVVVADLMLVVAVVEQVVVAVPLKWVALVQQAVVEQVQNLQLLEQP